MECSTTTNNNIATVQKIVVADKKCNEDLARQIEQLREKIFFSAITHSYEDKNITDAIKKNSIRENDTFYDTLAVATGTEVTKIFINLICKLFNIDRFYCDSKHLDEFNHLIYRIINEVINKDIALRFNCCCYWLYGLVNILENFQHQHKNSSAINIISKESVAIRLEECLVNLDLCWDGMSSRFAHEYEILNAMQQGLTGKILLVKKYLFQKAASQFMGSLTKHKNYNIPKSEEIHIYNLLHKTVAKKLGFIDIVDQFIPENFPVSFAKEFKELTIIDISPANITFALAEQLYETLTSCLVNINLQDWLTKPKKEAELIINLNSLETLVFAPTNALFNAQEQKLSINSIIDIEDINDTLVYSLNRSKEKLHLWVATNLIPNTEKLLITNVYNEQTHSYFSIFSVDYLFFGIIKQDDYQAESQFKFNTDNYITLNLSHIKQLDFITFSEVNVNDHLCLFEYPQKITTSISLVTQALRQTHNPIIILDFFTNNKILQMLQQIPLLQQKLDSILMSRLSNAIFKKQFIDNIISHYITIDAHIISKNELSFFIKHKIFFNIFTAIILTNINIDECFNINTKEEISFIINYLKRLDILELKKIVNQNNAKQIFQKILNCAEDDLINKLLPTGYCNAYINIISNNSRKETALALATRKSNTKLIDLLLKFDNIRVTGREFYNCFKLLYSEVIYTTFIEYIKNNLYKYSKTQIIELLQAKGTNGDVAISTAMIKRELFTLYVNFIFSFEELNFADKLSIINLIKELPEKNHFIYTFIANFLEDYITTILKSDQAFAIIQSKDINGDTALASSIKAHNWFIVKLYIKHVLTSDVFTSEQKTEIMLAKNIKNNSILSSLMQIECVTYTIQKYMEYILTSNQLDTQQKFKIMSAVEDSISNTSLLKTKIRNQPDNIICYTALISAAKVFNMEQKLELFYRSAHK